MTDDRFDAPDLGADTGDRVIERRDVPDHGPGFWAQLDAALQDVPAGDQGAAAASSPAASPRADRTAPMPVVQPLRPATPPGGAGSRRWAAPLAAAAAVLVAAGIFLGFPRLTSDPSDVTEVVSATDETATAAALEVPTGGAEADAGDSLAAPTVDAAPDTSDDQAPDDPTPDDQALESSGATTAEATATGSAASAGTTDGVDGADESERPEGQGVPPLPNLDRALGAVGEPDHLPLDQGLPADAEFLANWPERRLSWYAVTDPDSDCTSAGHSQVRYVNASGLTQPVRDPQPTYSGEISHFTVSDSDQAAWLVTCGNQAELFTANLRPTGEITDQTLAWFGQASAATALVQWDEGLVDLASVEPGGAAFSISYDPATGLVARNGGPSRIILEAGAPSERSLTALAATPDAGLTYFAGTAPAGTVSACPELFGSGRSDTLWLRQGEGLWQPAAGDFRTGTVTAAALEADTLVLAFADVCAGQSGRVIVGNVLDDGRIDVTRELDLSPYVPGVAAQLHWVDADTLRIETDNAEFGFGIVRFDFALDSGEITQLD